MARTRPLRLGARAAPAASDNHQIRSRRLTFGKERARFRDLVARGDAERADGHGRT
jgi:hypothetical protein